MSKKINIKDTVNITNKPLITKDVVLEHADDVAIFAHYIKDFQIGKVTNSPLRKDDIPSFGVYKTKNDTLRYNDYVLGGGSCFKFVKELFDLSSWFEVYSQIAYDMGFHENYGISPKILNRKRQENPMTKSVRTKDTYIDLKIRRRPWTDEDVQYWAKYGVSMSTLSKYYVEPITHVFLFSEDREIILPTHKIAYAFREMKDRRITYKIYQPYSKHKWMSSHNSSIWQGWTQLPATGRSLIITKSLKDVMAITENTTFPAVALQEEGAVPKPKVIEQLHQRFENIYVLYDNDYDKERNWGKEFGQKFAKEWGATFIMLPTLYSAKDFSDFIKMYGSKRARQVLHEIITATKIS